MMNFTTMGTIKFFVTLKTCATPLTAPSIKKNVGNVVIMVKIYGLSFRYLSLNSFDIL